MATRFALFVLALALSGCSGSGEDAAPPVPGAASTSAAVAGAGSTPRSSPTPTVRPENAGSEGVPARVTSREICAALKGLRPMLRGGDDAAARAVIGFGLRNVYAAKSLPTELDRAAIDTMTRKTCPNTRAVTLRAAGLRSFAQL